MSEGGRGGGEGGRGGEGGGREKGQVKVMGGKEKDLSQKQMKSLVMRRRGFRHGREVDLCFYEA